MNTDLTWAEETVALEVLLNRQNWFCLLWHGNGRVSCLIGRWSLPTSARCFPFFTLFCNRRRFLHNLWSSLRLLARRCIPTWVEQEVEFPKIFEDGRFRIRKCELFFRGKLRWILRTGAGMLEVWSRLFSKFNSAMVSGWLVIKIKWN